MTVAQSSFVLARAFIPPDGFANDGQRLAAKLLPLVLTAATGLYCFHLWRIGNVNLTLSDVLFVAALGLQFGVARLKGAPLGAMTPLLFGSLMLMLAGLFVGSMAHGDVMRWLIVATQYLFSFLILPMMLAGQEEPMLDRLVVAMITGVALLELAGVIGYCTLDYNQATKMLGPDFLTGGRRLGSFVGDANWNSAVIATCLPFVLFAAKRRLLPAVVTLTVGGLLVWALLLAASFTGFCAGVFASAVIMVAAGIRPSPRIIAVLLLAISIFLVSGAQLPEIFAKRVAPALENGSLDDAGTYDDRAKLIAEAWEVSEQTAIIGMGTDQFRHYSPTGQPVHNMYMLAFVEGGMFALLGWLGIVATLIAIPLIRLRTRRLQAGLSLAVTSVFLVFTMASPHMYHRLWTVPVLIALGYVLCPRCDGTSSCAGR